MTKAGRINPRRRASNASIESYQRCCGPDVKNPPGLHLDRMRKQYAEADATDRKGIETDTEFKEWVAQVKKKSVTSVTATAAEPITIGGYPLGQRFTMPKCPTNSNGTTDFIHAQQTCWAPYSAEGGEEAGEVWWQQGLPPIGSSMRVLVRNGIFAAANFSTGGLNAQDSTLNQLPTKFGEPTSFNREPMQTRFGMKFDACFAVWDKPNVYVEFEGVTDRVDEGTVEIQTPAEHSARQAHRLQRPKL